MKRQLQGIGIILFSIMMILGMGDAPVFDVHLRFSGDYMRRWDAFGTRLWLKNVLFCSIIDAETVICAPAQPDKGENRYEIRYRWFARCWQDHAV